jgi:hypothetical protein
MPLMVPDWVPEAARRRMNELYTEPWVGDRGRALLQRLATYPAMKTEVWGELPSKPKGVEGRIIDRAVHAVMIFPRLRRPYPKTRRKWREWAVHREKNPPLPEPAYASSLALALWEQIVELRTDTEANPDYARR